MTSSWPKITRPIAARTCTIRAPSASVAARIAEGSSWMGPIQFEVACGVPAIPPDIRVTPSAFASGKTYRLFRRRGEATYIALQSGSVPSHGERSGERHRRAHRYCRRETAAGFGGSYPDDLY